MRQSNSTGRIWTGIALGVLGALVGAIGLSSVADAGNAPRRQARTTHLGVPVSDIVSLRLINPTTTPIFVRTHDDGTQDTTEFVVPAGRAFLATSVDWAAQVATSQTDIVTLRLFIENRATSTTRTLVHAGAYAHDQQNQPELGASYELGTGVVMGANGRFVVDIIRTSSVRSANLVAFASTRNEILIRGYLTSAD